MGNSLKHRLAVAFSTAKICIRNKSPKEIWISPIPDELKDKVWNMAEKSIQNEKALEREPNLF
jgi:hypothetical protein